MGVLNVTPDSFSDGGRFLAPEDARAGLWRLASDGAAICDVGAESTRPGAAPVPVDEQLRRLEPVFEVMDSGAGIAISIDTSSAAVAEAALSRGAVLVNDVTAGRADPEILGVAASHGAAVCLVHMQGDPATMQLAPAYDDVVVEVRAFFEERIDAAVSAGVPEERILLDPGIGFGKRLQDNLALLAASGQLAVRARPIVIGVSRKSMFAALLGREVDERLAASLSAGLAAVARGAQVLRVHDVRETVDALTVWAAVGGAA